MENGISKYVYFAAKKIFEIMHMHPMGLPKIHEKMITVKNYACVSEVFAPE